MASSVLPSASLLMPQRKKLQPDTRTVSAELKSAHVPVGLSTSSASPVSRNVLKMKVRLRCSRNGSMVASGSCAGRYVSATKAAKCAPLRNTLRQRRYWVPPQY